MNSSPNTEQKQSKKGFSGLQVFGIVTAVILVTVLATLLAVRLYLFPRPFEPVVLSAAEQQQLEAKLDRLGTFAERGAQVPAPEQEKDFADDGRLIPRKYGESPADRTVSFTERELNALIATNTDLADKLAIDLSDNLISARMLLPVDPDFPVFGGKTLRVRAGIEVAYREGRPVIKLKGISLMGVPLPNAWLGGIKNVDLVSEFSGDQGFWKAFGDGIESISVAEGALQVRVRE